MRSFFRNLPSSWSRLISELDENRREYLIFTVSLVLAGTVAVISLGFFIKLSEDLYSLEFKKFDEDTFEILHSLRSPNLNYFFTAITDLGSAYAYLVIIPVIGLWLYYRGHRWSTAIQSIIVLLSSFLFNVALKYFVARPRPVGELRLVEAFSYSYPSGHSMSAVAFYGFLIYLIYKYLDFGILRAASVSLLTLLIILIGVSRVYLGVHYATDVLAGFVVGLFWLMTCIIIIRSVEFYRRSRIRKLR